MSPVKALVVAPSEPKKHEVEKKDVKAKQVEISTRNKSARTSSKVAETEKPVEVKEEKRERKPAIDLSVIGTKIAKPLTPVATRKRDVKAEEKKQAVEKKQEKIIAAVVSPKKPEPVKVKEPEVKRVSRSTVAEAVKSVSKYFGNSRKKNASKRLNWTKIKFQFFTLFKSFFCEAI